MESNWKLGSYAFLAFSVVDACFFNFSIPSKVLSWFLAGEQVIQLATLIGFISLLNLCSLIYYWATGDTVFEAYYKATKSQNLNVISNASQRRLNNTFNKSLNTTLNDFKYRSVDDNANSSLDKTNWSQIFTDSFSAANYSSDSKLDESSRSKKLHTTGPNSLELSSFSSTQHSVYTDGQYERLRFKQEMTEDSNLNDSSFARKIDFIFSNSKSSFSDLNSKDYHIGYQKGEERKLDESLANIYKKIEEAEQDEGKETRQSGEKILSILKRRTSVSQDEFQSSFQRNAEKLREASNSFHSNHSLNQLFYNDKSKKSNPKENQFYQSVIHKLNLHDPELALLTKFSLKFRFFLHENAVKPFVKAVDDANLSLKKLNLNLTVGTAKLEELQFHLDQRPDLYGTELPFLLPFLKMHSNQHYLVKRLRELNKSNILHGYQHDKTGETENDDVSSIDEKWNSEYPTDAEIVFGMFCLYMDHVLVPESLTKTPTRPFSSIYVFKEPGQLAFNQKLPTAFFIRQRHQGAEILFEFVANGGADIYTLPAGSQNMFASIYLFLNHCSKHNGGYLGDLRLDRKGLNLAFLLSDD